MSQIHALVVTGEIDDQGIDGRSYHIEHHGPVESCALWVQCPPDLPCHTAPERESAIVFTSHGVEHQGIDDDWGVRADPVVCVYTSQLVDDQLPDLAVDMTIRDPNGSLNEVPLIAGRYAIRPTWLGDGEFDLTIVTAGHPDA